MQSKYLTSLAIAGKLAPKGAQRDALRTLYRIELDRLRAAQPVLDDELHLGVTAYA